MANQTLDNFLFFCGGYGAICAADANHQIVLRGDRNGCITDYSNYYQYGGTLAAGLGHKFWTGGVLASQTLKVQFANDGNYFACNVGIGTTSPAFSLDVCAPVNNQGIRINGVQAPALYLYSVYNDAGNRNWGIYTNSQVFGDFDVRQSNAKGGDMTVGANGTSRFYIKNDGNVGIGLTDPSTTLSVYNSGGSYGYKTIKFDSNDSANGTRILIANRCNTACRGYAIVVGGTPEGPGVDKLSIGYYGCDSTYVAKDMFAITCTGNIGIGTTSPSYRLVTIGNEGAIHLRVNSDGVGSNVHIRPNAGRCGWVSFTEDAVADRWGIGIKNGDSKLYFSSGNVSGDGGTARMVLDGSGNLGIGTAALASNIKLQICDGNAAGTDDMVRLMQCLPGNHAFYRAQRCGGATMIMGPTRNSGDGCIPSESAIIWTTGNNPIVIGTCGIERMRFATSGNAVLGGTSSNIVGFTGTVLTVNGGGNYQGYEVSTSNVTRMTMVSDGNNGYLSTRVAGMCLIFEAGAASEKMRIASDGNVLINRTTVSGGGGRLEVEQNPGETGIVVNNTSCTTNYPAIYLRDAGGAGYGILSSNTALTIQAYGAERMRIKNGCIGVGTTNPTYAFHVNGTFYAAGSSIKYKEGICNYDTDSCLFMCLKPVTYQYKDEWQHLGRELKSQSQIGLIAEDVAEVMPELAVLVNEEDEKVVRNVDYEKLSVVLLKEVQKLRLEVDQLKNNK